jgi:hypothetical protein
MKLELWVQSGRFSVEFTCEKDVASKLGNSDPRVCEILPFIEFMLAQILKITRKKYSPRLVSTLCCQSWAGAEMSGKKMTYPMLVIWPLFAFLDLCADNRDRRANIK